MRVSLIVIMLVPLFVINKITYSQSDSLNKLSLSTRVDIMSRYIWRGQDYGQSPSIQPDLSAGWKNFYLGCWGAYKLNGTGDQETDFYLTKEFGPLSIGLYDYWSFNDTSYTDFFNYKKGSTSHLLEAQLLISGGEKIPFNFLTGYFFYGNDTSKSLYMELQYVKEFSQNNIMIFIGGQAKGTYYSSHPAIVNIGCSVERSLFTKSLDILLNLSLIFNPDKESVYLVAGISL